MKKIILIWVFVFACCTIFAQVETKNVSTQTIEQKIKLKNDAIIDVVKMPSFDVNILLAEDKKEAILGGSFRFGKDFDVNYTMKNSGTWLEIEDGRIWALKIVSEGAYSINLAYDKFYLPEKSELYIYNEDKTVLQGPFSSENNTQSGEFASDLLAGQSVVLVYFEPDAVKDEGVVSISNIVHGYKKVGFNAGGRTEFDNFGLSQSCNENVVCDTTWKKESNAVGLIIFDRNKSCSGVLINNGENFKPYFLTAYHCYQRNPTPSQWIFRFQYKSPDCNPSVNSTAYISYVGASSVVLNPIMGGTDTALLLLSEQPKGETGITYAGISRSNVAPSNTTGIHHPKGDVMKISSDNSSPSTANPGASDYGAGNNAYWQVNYKSNPQRGIVEDGSSGSPLFNSTHQVVGIQSSIDPSMSCDGNPQRLMRAWYGQLSETIATWEAAWIDAGGDPFPLVNATETIGIPYISTNIEVMCGLQQAFKVENVPLGATVTWTHNGLVTELSGQGTDIYTIAPATTNTHGYAWVEVEIRGLKLRKEFWIGKPSFALSGDSEVSLGDNGVLYVVYQGSSSPSEQGITNVDWVDIANGSVRFTGGNKFKGGFRTVKKGSGAIGLRLTNVCGSTEVWFPINVVSPYCCPTIHDPCCIRISKNPTNDNFTIDIDENTLPLHLRNEEIKLVLHNKMMTIKKVFIMQGRSKTIDVSDLPTDVYILRITIGNEESFEKKIVVTD